jgi:hypothetical protein
MSILKNSFGISVTIQPQICERNFQNRMTGSSLLRTIKIHPSLVNITHMERLLKNPLKLSENEDHSYEPRVMSRRTQSKIRKKLIAFARIHQKLTFVTLTFVNKVSDRLAIKVLGTFLDNVSKRFKDFQYIWVVEKQTKNKIFENNIHFHLVTNKYWEISRWWAYWVEVQKKFGVIPRNQEFNPTSAFDVKTIKSNNIKAVGNYITKYVTKNKGSFHGMLWNCSKKISQLYTDFYTDQSFLEEFRKMEKDGSLKGKIKSHKLEHCTIHFLPLNEATTKFYTPLDEINKKMWEETIYPKC